MVYFFLSAAHWKHQFFQPSRWLQVWVMSADGTVTAGASDCQHVVLTELRWSRPLMTLKSKGKVFFGQQTRVWHWWVQISGEGTNWSLLFVPRTRKDTSTTHGWPNQLVWSQKLVSKVHPAHVGVVVCDGGQDGNLCDANFCFVLHDGLHRVWVSQ